MGSEKRFLEKLNKKRKKNKNDGSLNTGASHMVPENHGGRKETVGSGKVMSDPRFSSLHTDPRFREPPKRKTKVAIDSRFDRIFTDKSFLPSSAPVDKRGKLRGRNLRQSSLRHYYRMDEEENGEDGEDVEERSYEEDEGEEKGRGLVESDEVKLLEESSEFEDEEDARELESSTDTDEDADEEIYDEELPAMQVCLLSLILEF